MPVVANNGILLGCPLGREFKSQVEKNLRALVSGPAPALNPAPTGKLARYEADAKDRRQDLHSTFWRSNKRGWVLNNDSCFDTVS